MYTTGFAHAVANTYLHPKMSIRYMLHSPAQLFATVEYSLVNKRLTHFNNNLRYFRIEALYDSSAQTFRLYCNSKSKFVSYALLNFCNLVVTSLNHSVSTNNNTPEFIYRIHHFKA